MFRISLMGLLVLAGCSGDAGNPDLRKSAEELHASGVVAFNQGEYETAFADLGEACKGGLNADLYSEALVFHAVAAVHLGKLDIAKSDLEILDQGATNMDVVFAAKSFLALKKGNKSEAKKYLQQARRINSKIKPFKN